MITNSEEDITQIVNCSKINEIGMKTKKVKGYSGRCLIFDVPRGWSDSEILKEIWSKNGGGMHEAKFNASSKVVDRRRLKDTRDGEYVDNVVIESDRAITDKWVSLGRLFLGFRSLKVRIFHHIVRCFTCLEYGHVSNHCKGKTTCWKCGQVDHMSKDCPGPKQECVNCKKKKLPETGHNTLSRNCQVFKEVYQKVVNKYING